MGGYNTSNGVMTNQWYTYERGTLRNASNPLYWDGLVGLMYPSDFGYAAGNSCVTETSLYTYKAECKSNNWLWMTNTEEWLMTQNSGGSVFRMSAYGYTIFSAMITNDYSIRPTFYLTSNTLITNGDGSIGNPYLIGL